MRKIGKFLGTILLLACLFWCGTVAADRKCLDESVIRLHVVAASDEEADQALKLQVRDAVLETLHSAMAQVPDAKQAQQYIRQCLQKLEDAANDVLREAGSSDTARVTLGKETFARRDYDSFSLPAGVYESLRVTIGPGEGKNWWCVIFPELCAAQSKEAFSEAAAQADFSAPLSGALQRQEPYQIRFFFLDCLGWLENLFSR